MKLIVILSFRSRLAAIGFWMAWIASLLFTVNAFAMTAVLGGAIPDSVLPKDYPWNDDISAWPVDPQSASYIGAGTTTLHADLGGDVPDQFSPNAIFGVPYIQVSSVKPKDLVAVQFSMPAISDGVDHVTNQSFAFYPIPPEAITQAKWIQGGEPGNVDMRATQDRHMIIVDIDNHFLYELLGVFYDIHTGQWHADSGAFWDLTVNNIRPDMWMSADAAGLAMLPGLLRYDEVFNSPAEINHAFRFTLAKTDSYVFPATHWGGMIAGSLPLGARLRLKEDVDIAGKTDDPGIQKIFRAMKKHGLILADIGSNMYVSGSYDPRWDTSLMYHAFLGLSAADFEVIELGYPEIYPSALSSLAINPGVAGQDAPISIKVHLTRPAPTGGAVISLATSIPGILIGSSKVKVLEGDVSAIWAGRASNKFATDTTATVSATYKNVVLKAPFKLAIAPEIDANAVSSISVNPRVAQKQESVSITVKLKKPAPKGGILVLLATSTPGILIGASKVKVLEGNVSAIWTGRASNKFAMDTTTTVSATYKNMVLKTPFKLAIAPEIAENSVSSISVNPGVAQKNEMVSIIVKLKKPAHKGGVVVSLATSTPGILIGASKIKVLEGNLSAIWTGRASGKFAVDTTATVTATYKNVSAKTPFKLVINQPG